MTDETPRQEHSFFAFEKEVDRATVRELSLQLANYYLKRNLSRSGWKRAPRRQCVWETPIKKPTGVVEFERRESRPLNLFDLERHLSSGAFAPETLGLPAPMCFWLDSSIEMSPHFHAAATDGSHALTFFTEPTLGKDFPIVPALDREGAVFTSFQTILLRRIHRLRQDLTERSSNPGAEPWFQDFRTVVSECVSLIDNTLHQLYLKAEFDCPPGWTFDKNLLEERHGRRMSDKLRWVRQITGRDLNAQDAIRAFDRLRELRNHLQHFDPPSFAFTFEEAASWLNDILAAARLAWRIRICADALPSLPLISLMLQRRVRFQPIHPAQGRIRPPPWSGYGSTRWRVAPRPDVSTATAGVRLAALPPIRIVTGDK